MDVNRKVGIGWIFWQTILTQAIGMHTKTVRCTMRCL